MIILYLIAAAAVIVVISKGGDRGSWYDNRTDEEQYNYDQSLDRMWQAPPQAPPAPKPTRTNTWPAPRAEERQG